MATSQIVESANSLLDKLAAIPFDWNGRIYALSGGFIPTTDKPAPGKLLQSLALWNNQPRQWRQGKGNKPIMPCCYIQAVFGKALNMGLGVSLYQDFKWKIHLIDELQDGYNESGGLSHNNQVIGGLDQNLEVMAWRDLIKTNLEMFFPLHCGAMTEVDEQQDEEHEELYHYVMDFACAFSDLKGSVLDPDQDKVIYIDPPIGLVMSLGFNDGTLPPDDSLISYIWKDCLVSAQIVATPDPMITQVLDNGAEIPLQYALNGDDTLTIPYLNLSPAINVLTPFFLNNDPYPMQTATADGVRYANINGAGLPGGTFDFVVFGGFSIGQNIQFNASLPIGLA